MKEKKPAGPRERIKENMSGRWFIPVSYTHLDVYKRQGKMIADETDCIDVYDINLTMKGLYLIYQKSKGK